jgi:4-carboxymuconolactone decarboxylase
VSGPATPLLPLVDQPDDPLVREKFAKLASGSGILNLHRMMAHAPPAMKASGDMAIALRNDTILPRSLAELAILRTAQVVDCDYVWRRHLSLAREAGVTQRQIDELAHWQTSAAFTPVQKTALLFTERAARLAPLADEDFAELRRYFSPREIVELTMVVGFYVSTALLIKALKLPDEKS